MIERNHAREQAMAQVMSIVDLVEDYKNAETEEAREEALNRIWEDPLSIEVRPEWALIGQPFGEAEEYRIILCTGGPHVELVGTLEDGQPDHVEVIYQDWGTPRQEYFIDGDIWQAVLKYACLLISL